MIIERVVKYKGIIIEKQRNEKNGFVSYVAIVNGQELLSNLLGHVKQQIDKVIGE